MRVDELKSHQDEQARQDRIEKELKKRVHSQNKKKRNEYE
jgi:hypothetical protein